MHRSQAVALLLFEETRRIAETGALCNIKVCPSEAEMLRSSSSASFMSRQQKERRSLNWESLGGSKLCLVEADEAKSRTTAGRSQPLLGDLGHLIMAVGPQEGSVKPSPLLEDSGLCRPLRKQSCNVQHLHLAGAILQCLRDCLIKSVLHCHISNCFFHTLLQVVSKIASSDKR